MRTEHALQALARLAAADSADRVGALSEAASIVGAVLGSEDVRLFAGDAVTYEAYPPRKDEDFFGLSLDGLVSVTTEIRRLGRAAVCTVRGDGVAGGVAPADGSNTGTHLALALWRGDAFSGTILVPGHWAGSAARRAGRFLEAAGPALSILFDRVADADRPRRVQHQMNVLASVAHVFTRAENMRDVLGDLTEAINSATDLFSSIDVLDSQGRIVLRSAAASRYTGTPLHKAWRDMTGAPDHIGEMILESHQPVLLPDLHNDPRVSEEAREFYRAATIVSGATFPLLLQDEVVGLLRVGSLKPTSFPQDLVDLLQSLAVQAAVVVKGVQLWEELQRSRKETELYAAKLQASMEIEHHLARIDHLCGIPNRRYMDEVLTAECARTARYGAPLSLAMADLDDFKRVNDMHGHDAGDDVLRQFATVARSACRRGDMVGRVGGDEFLFVLPATGLEKAIVWAQRFRGTWEETVLLARGDTGAYMTVSLGLAEAGHASAAAPEVLLRRCDESLYEAKAAGKNAVRWQGQTVARAS